MKKIITIIALCLSPLAMAEGFDWHGSSLELLVGHSDQELRAGDDHHEEESNTSYGIRAGYAVSDHFTIETAYRDYGEYDHTYVDSAAGINDVHDEIHTTSYDVGIKAALHFPNHNISFTYRMGYSAWDTDLDISAPSVGLDDSDHNSGVDPYFGVGLQYIHPSGFMISLETSRLHYDGTLDTPNLYGDYSSTLDTTSIAIGKTF